MSPAHVHNVLDLACRTALGTRAPVHVAFPHRRPVGGRRDLMRYKRNEDRAFLERAQQGIADWWRPMEQRGARTELPMKPQVVAWHLAEALADDAIVCGDSGTRSR